MSQTLDRNIRSTYARLIICEPTTRRELYLTPRLRIIGLYPDAETIPLGSESLGIFTRTISFEDFEDAVKASDRVKAIQ